MQTTSYHFPTPEALCQADWGNISILPAATLVQLYLCDPLDHWIEPLQQLLQQRFPDAIVAGITSYGSLYQSQVTRQGLTMNITRMPSSHASQCFIEQDATDQAIKQQLLNALQANTKAVLLHSADWQDSHSRVLDALYQLSPDTVVAGTVASPQGPDKLSSVFNGTHHSNDGYLLTLLHGDQLQAQSVIKQNWFPIGKAMRVTKASGYRVDSIDGMRIHQVYQRYFGDLSKKQLIGIASVFPLMYYGKHHQKTALLLQSFEDGSCLFNRQIPEGAQVWIAFANMDSLLDNHYLEDYPCLPAGCAFIFSCGGRLELLKDSIQDELAPIRQMVPTVGCFGFGEIGQNQQGQNCLLSHAMSILFLSEDNSCCRFSVSPTPVDPKDELSLTTSELLKFHTQLSKTLMADLEHSNQQLEKLSVTDTLTGLYNRKMLDQVLERAFQSYQRNAEPFVVLLLDIDHFKAVNDTYGHLAGDQVLAAVSQCLRQRIRPNDVLGRWGGEEFLLICPKTTASEAQPLAERLRTAVQSTTTDVQEHAIQVTISIGGAAMQSNLGIDDVLTLADRQLYAAKAAGRNRCMIDLG
ncbi:sensor domain-containing diguanylate cyclase [Alkalimonas mucilaginosa]|uniref:diguanylate cyclase n=1 Tax=Alkalimonas mucilaginosa TaxID=3057676 RepID=A0ABU7JK55_9GAMM|nr:GGDEF domain-containing protein [Alkalimonas sp. MEB004]MEE2026083.1 GGDEF domain-containing protein [Alkalimonas sp. MEB004]